MATIEDIKEDFFYVYIVELAFLISIIFNFIYAEDWNNVIKYSLIFWGIFITEDKILNSLILSKLKDLKEIFHLIRKWKKLAKAALALYLSLLILLSSWGIISYLEIYMDHIKSIAAIVIQIFPFYIAIYAGWLLSLSYIRAKYVKLLIAILKKRSATRS